MMNDEFGAFSHSSLIIWRRTPPSLPDSVIHHSTLVIPPYFILPVSASLPVLLSLADFIDCLPKR